MSIVKESKRRAVSDAMHVRVEARLKALSAFSHDRYAVWELMHQQPLSRHYSYSMVRSVKSFSACLLPALSNDLLDISLRLSAPQKANSSVYKTAIGRLNPVLGHMINANTNVGADLPSLLESAIVLSRKAVRRTTPIRTRVPPRRADRSWVSTREIVAESGELMSRLQALPKSEILAEVDAIDMSSLARILDDHIESRHDHSSLLLYLLATESLLRQTLS